MITIKWDEYLSEYEINNVDFDKLKEYLNGWEDAIIIVNFKGHTIPYYKKHYIHLFLNR